MSTKFCLKAAKDHDWLKVETFIKQGYTMDPELTTLAASQGQRWALEMLIEYGCEWSKNTVLMAAWNDFEHCFNYALDHGATIHVMAIVTLMSKPFVRSYYIDRLFKVVLACKDPLIEEDFILLLNAVASKNLLPLVKQLYAHNSSLFQSSQIKEIIIKCTYYHLNSIDCAMFLLSEYLKYRPIDSQLFQACLSHDIFLPYTQPIIEDVFSFAPVLQRIQTQIYTHNLRMIVEHLPIEHQHKLHTDLLHNIHGCVQTIWFVQPILYLNAQTVWLMLSYYPHFRHHHGVMSTLVRYIDKFITTELYLHHLDILDPIVQDSLRHPNTQLYVFLHKCYLQAAALTATKELQRLIPAGVVRQHISPFLKDST